ncbi:MAG: pentapeptide repeat-containing protein [Acidimicrobiia bacterium]|nr:pentapeptide repeat-containing protein [Acidimicrobiia bacterium]
MGARWVRCTASWCSCKPDVHVPSSHHQPTGCPVDTHCTYVFDVRYGRFLTVISIVVLVGGCGESHPTAKSPDDTHSVAELATENGATTNIVVDGVDTPGDVAAKGTTTTTIAIQATSTSSLPSVSQSATAGASATSAGMSVNAGASVGATPTTQPTVTVATPVQVSCDPVPGASCAGADLRGQEFPYANLQGVDFSGAILNGVDFTGADLSGANFTGANLTSANLSETVLFGTDFTGVRLTRTNLQYVLWDDSTIWPSGFTPPDF